MIKNFGGLATVEPGAVNTGSQSENDGSLVPPRPSIATAWRSRFALHSVPEREVEARTYRTLAITAHDAMWDCSVLPSGDASPATEPLGVD